MTQLYTPTGIEEAAVIFLNRKGRDTFANTVHELSETYLSITLEAADPPTRYTLDTLADVSHLLRELYAHAVRAVRVYGAEFDPMKEQDPRRIGFTIGERG